MRRVFVRFLEESLGLTICFRNYLTFKGPSRSKRLQIGQQKMTDMKNTSKAPKSLLIYVIEFATFEWEFIKTLPFVHKSKEPEMKQLRRISDTEQNL